MSITQKIEDSYLAILRVVILFGASCLLLVAVVFGVLSLRGLFPGAEPKVEAVAVDPKDVLARMTPAPADSAKPEVKKDEGKGKKEAHPAEYDKVFTTVNAFVTAYSKETESINKEKLFAYLDVLANEYGDREVRQQFIAGLAPAIDVSLHDRRVVARVETPPAPVKKVALASSAEAHDGTSESAQPALPAIDEQPSKESPVEVVQEALQTYVQLFNQKLAQAKDEQQAKQQEQLEAKANAASRLYVAVGGFATFLIVVFISIAIRIERNLRTIAAKP